VTTLTDNEEPPTKKTRIVQALRVISQMETRLQSDRMHSLGGSKHGMKYLSESESYKSLHSPGADETDSQLMNDISLRLTS
jgi:hypothetical protein